MSTILPVASLVFRAFVRFVRADERMPRMSGVVKNEGEYEFQMGCGGAASDRNPAAIASHRPVPGWVQCPPASGARWRRDLKKILVGAAPCDLATSPTAAVYAPAH